MPELPDISIYVESLESRISGAHLEKIEIRNPFLLRTADPPVESCIGLRVLSIRRLGKRIAIGLENDLWLVIHLMIAGRFHWYTKEHKGKQRPALMVLQFSTGTLTLTEAGTKRRASLHVVLGDSGLALQDRGGLEVLTSSRDSFVARMTKTNHTLKRALTDPTILSGIGNAYSDEILFRAKLSPLIQSKQMDDERWTRLFEATRSVLREWIDRLRAEAAEAFPEGVTAFRKEMAVHGRFAKPCVECGTAIQRIRYADNETNYCPRCQTDGKLLADRGLSRLLKDDWPKTIEALENRKRV
jgi:formamidopyrimidine-DNA glycosylase